MSFTSYVKNSIWDFVLCAIASSALCYVCLVAFLSTVPFQSTPWVAIGSCTLVTAILFIIAYNFKTAIIGSVAFVIAVCICCGICSSFSPAESLFEDVVGNNVYLVIEVVLSSLAVFLLSRKKALTIVLLVGGLILCAVIEYLYWCAQIVPSGIFCIATVCLYAYRNYQQSLIGSDSETISFGSPTLAAGVIGLLSVGLSIGVFFLLIAPLNPPSATVKLLTKHVRLEEEHVVGTGDEMSVINEQLFSWNVSGSVSGTGTSEGEDAEEGDNQESENGGEDPQKTGGSSFNIDNSELEMGSATRIVAPNWLPVVIRIVLLLLVVLVIAVRKMMRKRRCERIRALPNRERVEQFYRMFVSAFGKMKIGVPQCQTLREYVGGAVGEIGRFEGVVDKPVFEDLTQTYSDVMYGAKEPSDGELKSYDDYYRTFYRNARRFVGPVKYIRLFFRI